MKINKQKTFLNRLRKAFIITILIPVLVLGGAIFYFAAGYLNEQRNTESLNIIEQNITDLNNRVKACDNSIRYLSANYDLMMYLMMPQTNYDDQNKAQKNIGNMLYNVMLTNAYYKNLKIYTDTYQPVLMEFFKPISDIKDKDWYNEVLNSDKTFWQYEDNKIYIRRAIRSSYPVKTLGIISVEINSELIKQSFNIFDNMPIQITAKEGKTEFYIYETAGFNDNIGYEKTQKLSDTGFYITYSIDNSYYDEFFIAGLLIPICVVAGVLFLTWITIYFASKRLSRDLHNLVCQVNTIQNGELDFVIQPSNITEIAILGYSIQNLVNRIKQLIKEVYAKEIKRQELELNLLQSKIRPHFLYNNLSAINWLAIECGQDKIYQIATELATFYRTSLNNGKNIDTLSVEISNIKSYLNLQLISHENSFDIEYDIEPSLYEQITPIFIMQPLVENAIEHGIDQLRNEHGLIKISVKTQGEFVKIDIFDNCTELFKKIGANELDYTKFGYGTSNVHKRLQLLCGKNAGVKITAAENGTISTIMFPKEQTKWSM